MRRFRLIPLLRWILRAGFAGIVLFGGSLATVLMRFSPLLFILYGISQIGMERTADTLGIVSLVVGGGILGLCVIVPRFFCRYLCPQGFLFRIFGILRRIRPNSPNTPRIRNRWFQGTRLAWMGRGLALAIILMVAVGIRDGLPIAWGEPLILFRSLRTGEMVPHILCILLWGMELLLPGFWCRNHCPTGAIQELCAIPQRLRRGICPTRRRLLVGTVATIAVAGGLTNLRRFPDRTPGRLRPPGAVVESKFVSLCVRCGNCADVCPTTLIRMEKWAEFPTLRFRPAYCPTDCVACSRVCPVVAITPLTIVEKTDPLHRIGVVTLNWERCRLYEDHECRICVRECPQAAIEIVWSEEEYLPVPTIDAVRCSGCGRCVAFCPTECLRVIRPELIEPLSH